jgi:hypothetical protein
MLLEGFDLAGEPQSVVGDLPISCSLLVGASIFYLYFIFPAPNMTDPDSRFSLSTLPWFLGPLFFGCLSLYLGQDASWDLRNYHFYNAYAFLFHRLDFDMVPAHLATFYNPLLYIPYYELVTHLPPKMVGFVLGAVQGLNFPILIQIARCTLARDTVSWWRYYLVAMIGVLGAGSISETGTMFADNLTSLLILSSLWLFVANYHFLTERKMSHAFRLIGFGGFLMGAAIGLKQPAAIFAVGWCLAFLVIPVSFWRRIFLAFFFGIGVLAGIASSGGYWMYTLWLRFGNPLFPYFNQFFHSPMAALAEYRDTRFLHTGLWDVLLYPFLIVTDPHRTGEVPFRDLRFAVFSVVLIIAILLLIWRLLQSRPVFGEAVKAGSSGERLRYSRLFLLVGAIVACGVWMKLFAIYRYLLPLEMLAPLGIVLVINTFPWRPFVRDYAALFCAILILTTLQPGNWGRVAWGKTFFGVEPPPLADPANTMVLMTGTEPMAYMIPFFPESVRFVRIQSYLTGPAESPNGYDKRMHDLVSRQHSPLYGLFRFSEKEMSIEGLNSYGLAIDQESCKELRPHIEEHVGIPFEFCALTRTEPSNGKGKK